MSDSASDSRSCASDDEFRDAHGRQLYNFIAGDDEVPDIANSQLSARARILFLCRVDPLTSPFKWGLLSKSTDRNPFPGYRPHTTTLRTTYERNYLREYIKLVYAEIGVDADENLEVTSADIIIKVPTATITEDLSQGLNIKNYKQNAVEQEVNEDIVSASETLSGLSPHPSKGLGHGIFIGRGNAKEQIAQREQEVYDSDKAC